MGKRHLVQASLPTPFGHRFEGRFGANVETQQFSGEDMVKDAGVEAEQQGSGWIAVCQTARCLLFGLL